jgi:hypothetical protein
MKFKRLNYKSLLQLVLAYSSLTDISGWLVSKKGLMVIRPPLSTLELLLKMKNMWVIRRMPMAIDRTSDSRLGNTSSFVSCDSQ